jgi:adenylate cyclase
VSEDRRGREARNTMRHLKHELRTPIGQIIGYSELLQEEAAEAGHESSIPDLERIRQAALGLLQRVDEVLGGDGPDPASHAPAAPIRSARVAAPGPAEPSGHRILVVDDDPANRDLLTRRLDREGHDTHAVADGPTALELLAKTSFDLVLLDVLMPGMSGLEVLSAIRRERTAGELPVILATALDGSEDIVEGLRLGASDHVTKPFDFPVVMARVQSQLELKRANDEIRSLARHLEIRNSFIRRLFGRYVSDQVVDTLLEEPDAIGLSGEIRRVTILVADLRGFSSITADREPVDVLAVLNNYLGTMSELIQEHGGTVDDFFGDGILAFFGAPVAHEDHTHRALHCAVAMQLAVTGVNQRNRSQGLPEIEMGIGIATGKVIVGSMGSERRAKYGAIGLPVNLASRIESFTLGGEVLIDEETYASLGAALHIAETREVHPKGFETALRIHRVAGLHGGERIDADRTGGGLRVLTRPIEVEIAPLEGKGVGDHAFRGQLRELSQLAGRVEADRAPPEMTDVRLSFLEEEAGGLGGSCYAKVVSIGEGGGRFTLRFTAVPAELQRRIRALLAAGA